jgi:hypothetical protein
VASVIFFVREHVERLKKRRERVDSVLGMLHILFNTSEPALPGSCVRYKRGGAREETMCVHVLCGSGDTPQVSF